MGDFLHLYSQFNNNQKGTVIENQQNGKMSETLPQDVTESDVDSGQQTGKESLPSQEHHVYSNDKGASPLLAKSPKVKENLHEDELFTPMKALNFLDATDSDIQQNSDVEDNDDDGLSSIETSREKTEFTSHNNQSLRIIEGHASPLDDQTGQGFSFPTPTVPQTDSTGFLVSNDNYTESPNLYDSLDEHDDGDVPRSPRRLKFSPVPENNSTPNSRGQAQGDGSHPYPKVSPGRVNNSPGKLSNPSPGEILPNNDLMKRPDDIFEWSLPNQFDQLSYNSTGDQNLDPTLTRHFQKQSPVYASQHHSGSLDQSGQRYLENELPERFRPSGDQNEGCNSGQTRPTRREIVFPNHPDYSLISEADPSDVQEEGVDSFHSDQGPLKDESNSSEVEQFHSLPNMNQNADDGAPQKSNHPQKPTRQNLSHHNQRSKIPEPRGCSRQEKHDQRQIQAMGGARGKTGTSQNRPGTNMTRQQVQPRPRPNAQGGNVQERQKPVTRYPQNPSQTARQLPFDQHRQSHSQSRGGAQNDGQPAHHPSSQFENRIAGVGQDDIISRDVFTHNNPDSDDQMSSHSDNQISVTMRRSAMSLQREATVGYQNSDQYQPSYANSDVGSEDLGSVDLRYSPNTGRPYHVTHQSQTRSHQSVNQSVRRSAGGGGSRGGAGGNHHPPVDVNTDIQGMEEVRAHLHNMLRGNSFNDAPVPDATTSPSELILEHPISRPGHILDTSSLLGGRVPEDVPDIFENFPSFSSKIFTDINSSNIRTESSVQNENQYLRDALERERYRRKHCEEQIQQLNAKLLESQQQVAVAISTDKKKDIMIEQLDKQLARVVEGWRKRELEKDEYLKVLMKEKGKMEESIQKQQLVQNNFDRKMNEREEKFQSERMSFTEQLTTLEIQVKQTEKEKRSVKELLEGEKEKSSLMLIEWDQLKESRELAEKRAQVAQDRLHHEQDEFYRREQELLGKIDEVKDANLKVIHMERRKTDESEERIKELEDRIRQLLTETKKLDLTLDSTLREKESIKVEMSIMEAKYESASRKLEADLQAQMEKEICEQIEDVQKKMEGTVNEIQEQHRKQVIELQKRQQADLEKQLQEFHEQVLEKEEELRRQIVDGENQLREYRKENTSLKNIKQKLESQRMEVLTKLQYMMQSQWNEAVTLLINTPVRRRQLSAVSSIPPVPPDGNNSGINPSLNLSLQQLPKTSSPGRDGMVSPGRERLGSPGRERLDPFSQYIEDDGGVSRVEPIQRNTTQTARVEAYLNSLPVSSVGGLNPPPPPLPSFTHNMSHNTSQSYKPASHSITRQHQHQKLDSSALSQHQPNTAHQPSTAQPTSSSHQPNTANQHSESHQIVETLDPNDDETVVQFDHVTSDTYYSASQRPDSLLSETVRTLDSYNLALRYANISKSEAERPQSSGHNPRSPSQFVRPRSAENSPKANRYSEMIGQRGIGPSQFLRQHSDEGTNQFQSSVRSNLSQNSEMSSRSQQTEDIRHELLQSLAQSQISSDSELHHLLNQRIENYYTNQTTGQQSAAVMIRPPHQQSRPITSQNDSRLTNQMESTMNSSFKSDVDNRSVSGEGRLTLGDLNSGGNYSPPVKQARSRTPTDKANSDDGRTTVRLNVNYDPNKSQDQQFRQSELQHYLKMLLEKSPISSQERPVHDTPGDIDTSDLTLDLDLNDTQQAEQLNQDLLRFQQLRENQTAVEKKKREEASSSHGNQDLSSSIASLPGVIPPEQMAEISQLLSQYQHQLNQDGGAGQRSSQPPTTATSSNITSMLVTALNNLPRNQNGGKSKPSAKLSPRSNPPRKPTTQKPSSSSATRETHHEVKTEAPKKTDKKTVAVKPQKNKFWK